jgi:hypothetical protein
MSGCELISFIAKFNFDCFLVVLKESPLVLQRTFRLILLYGAETV